MVARLSQRLKSMYFEKKFLHSTPLEKKLACEANSAASLIFFPIQSFVFLKRLVIYFFSGPRLDQGANQGLDFHSGFGQ